MIVKICGIKTLEEALAAAECGAGMLGFNFYPPSPRAVATQTCASIVAGLKSRGFSPLTVGVFVNQSPERVRTILQACGLDLAQLSGDEGPERLAALNGIAFKAVRPRTPQEADSLLVEFARPQAPALLVDAHLQGAYGGTGRTGDWALARRLAARAPLLLAGGLNPANVAAAIQAVRPWGVDVASGVESSPGVKDPAKISAFISAAKSPQGE
jgi:phosphoribosylanthranilate isomerase